LTIMRRKMFILETVRTIWYMLYAEAWLRYSVFSRNKHMVAVMLFWPYLVVAVILVLGTGYGSVDAFQEAMGVADAAFFLFAASAVALSTVNVVEQTASSMLWARWLGTLPYIAMAVPSIGVHAAVSGIVASLTSTLASFAAIAPAIAVLRGPQGLATLIVLFIVSLAGMAVLAALGSLAAVASTVLRLESNVLAFITPVILLLSGAFYPVEILPPILEALSSAVPSFYAVEAARLAASFEAMASMYRLAYALAALGLLYWGGWMLVGGLLERRARLEGAV